MKTGMRMMAINNARRNRERMEVSERMEYGRTGGDEMRRGGGRMEIRGGEEMRRGGGRMGGYEMRERDPDRMGVWPHHGDEMSRRRGRDPQSGMAEHHRAPEFDMETAREWVESMKGEDGKSGEHWTMEQLNPIMQQRGIDAKPEEFWAIMNALYSDYCKVAKKHNVSTVDFYTDMAKAWLDDKDAVEDKAAAYYEYVVKHE